MKRVTRFSIAKESIEDMCKAGRYNRALEITFRDRTGIHTHKVGAGDSDEIHVYREETITFILSHNEGLGYFGLEAYEGAKKTGDIFVESHQVKDILGNEALAPFNAIKCMREYIQ